MSERAKGRPQIVKITPKDLIDGRIASGKVNGREVEISVHADDRMKSRGIKEEEILNTLRAPDQEGLPVDNPDKKKRWRKLRRYGGAVDVVWTEANGRIVVVTCMVTLTFPRKR